MTSSLVGSEMCIRDRLGIYLGYLPRVGCMLTAASVVIALDELKGRSLSCLLYTSDAADDM
eukprot:8620719-Prorocentrum_lima.AAC.1